MGRNTVGKEEIARYEQFLLFPQCFQKACFPGASVGVIVWEWVKPLPHFDPLKMFSSRKHCKKRKNCLFQAISCFLTVLSIQYGTFHFKCTLKCCLQFVSVWTSLKYCRLVMG